MKTTIALALLLAAACGAPSRVTEENGVVLDGLRISGKPGAGLRIENSRNVTVKNCVIFDNGGAGIELYGVIDVELEGNVIYGNRGAGIDVVGSKGVKIDHNVVAMPAASGPGLLLRDSTGSQLLRHNVLLHAAPARPGLAISGDSELAFLDSDHNVLERVAVGSTTLSLVEWQARGKDVHSTPPGDEVRDSAFQYGR